MTKRYYPEINGLRGLAALAVALFHYIGASYDSKPLFFEYGRHGVELFFIISGFVIFFSLNSKKNILNFIKARFIRLFPIFWFCVPITFIITTLYGPDERKVSVLHFLLNFFMMPKFLGIKFVDGAYWTLQIELFFYIVIALIFYFLKRFRFVLVYFCLITLTYALTNSFGINEFINTFDSLLLKSTYWRLYGLFIVEYSHLFLIGISIYSIRILNYKVGYLTLVFANIAALTSSTYDFYVVLCVTSIFCFAQLLFYLKKFLSLQFFQWLGFISYPFYLLHMNIGRIIIQKLSELLGNVEVSIARGLAVMLAAAHLVAYFVDSPLRSFVSKKVLPVQVPAKSG
ncbi:acyltransferase family protein [Synechococcus sp. BDU 130192]|uniref:acyltransferase family protein n=1 Tax=Synechococcus sp. BDU 130192 TaxID=2042059 RepID=UPI00117CE3A8|nr:acyltransferase [Synechococcus sp. BDU 130192]